MLDKNTDLRALTTLNDDITFVQFQSNQPVNGPLARWNRASDELPLGGEEVAIVQNSTKLDGGELVSQSTDIPVQGKTLQINMSDSQNGCTRRFVASSRFDTDESILDDIGSTNTVFPAQSVKCREDVYSISELFLIIRHHDFDGKTAFEFNGNALGSLWSFFRSCGEFPHVCRWSGIRILENTSLVRDVEKVLVGGPWLSCGLHDGDSFLLGISQKSLSAREAIVEF